MASSSPRARSRAPIQLVAAGFGVVFVLVGILGFTPGVTTGYDRLTLAGHMSGAALLGIFAVSVLHNVVHLLLGVAGLVLSRTRTTARAYLIGGGVVYLLLFAYGSIVDPDSAANVVPLNAADNDLHLGLAVAMIWLSVFLTPAGTPTRGSGSDAGTLR